MLTWWALATRRHARERDAGAARRSFVTGVWLDIQGLTTIGEIVAFMGLATMLIGRLEQIVGFVNFLFGQAPQARRSSSTCWTASPSVVEAPGARDVGRLAGHVRFEGVVFPTTASARR